MENPIRDRVLAYNGGNDDFTNWNSNARGVDLNHNYDYGFYEYKRLEALEGIVAGRTRYSGEYPESEPEVRSLLRLIRTVSPSLIVSFHTQGGEVYAQPKSRSMASLAARAAAIMRYKVGTPVSFAAYGGLALTVTGTGFTHPLGYGLSLYYGIPHGKACGCYTGKYIELNMTTEKGRERVTAFATHLGTTPEMIGTVIEALADVNLTLSDKEIDAMVTAVSGAKNYTNAPYHLTDSEASVIYHDLFGNG
jgi:hypothetical protein